MSAYSTRIETIAGLCKGPAIVDVGYDHGLLLRLLHERQPDWRLHGVEVGEHFARQAALPPAIDLRLGDALAGWHGPLPDEAVFAGLGEERIRGLLERDWSIVGQLRRLVICASSIDGRLRPWLNQRGWRCAQEQLVQDGRRLYLVSACEPGAETEADAERRAMGPRLFERPDPLLADWQRFWQRRFRGPRASQRE